LDRFLLFLCFSVTPSTREHPAQSGYCAAKNPPLIWAYPLPGARQLVAPAMQILPIFAAAKIVAKTRNFNRCHGLATKRQSMPAIPGLLSCEEKIFLPIDSICRIR
jgi:hypothetical protein